MEGATFSPERSQPNDQKSEGISINAITTAPDQLSPREGINGGEVADFPDSEDWEIVGYLDKNQIEQINGLDPNSDPDTLKAHKEIEWPALYFKTFTCFSRLPLELRRKIWFHALPEPRLVNFELYPKPELVLHQIQHPEFINIAVRDYTLTTDDVKNKEMSLDIHPFFLTCHEFRDVFLENYESFDMHTQLPADGRCLYTPPMLPTYSTICHVRMKNTPSQYYIDPKVDRLVFDSLEKSFEILSSIGITLNLSAFRNIAITQYSEQGNRSVVSESTWKAIEDNFPRLTSVNFCGNFAGAHVGRLPMRIPTLTRFHPLTQDTIGEVNRQTLYQDSHGLITPNAWIVNAHHMNVIARAAYKTKRSFLERSNTHGNYWKGVDFTISLWMEHTLHRAKDYIQLQPRRPIEGDQDNTYYTQAVGSFDIGSAYLKRSGGTSVIDCYADGTLFNSETAMKKDQLHGTHEGGKSKYLTWPWNCPSSDNGDSYDNSRFKNQVFRAL
ncbi:hypothetical protein BCIN_10g01670 [Botrytis cinerea B05.10]|uniref:2EXR domain-containing protein n=1 Tax=Botryotinia fuckeliana (strain B05.10) TaxID=332648 RepID=A0A384JV70_BOTFB|nr:hypothetical protein BCIN_10g01670 [Botrytis cinerea B05.10]ATZ54147.1 hypothetical protein BCIN_10g01670 [Botrytis cinerea B05.10]